MGGDRKARFVCGLPGPLLDVDVDIDVRFGLRWMDEVDVRQEEEFERIPSEKPESCRAIEEDSSRLSVEGRACCVGGGG